MHWLNPGACMPECVQPELDIAYLDTDIVRFSLS